MFSKGIQFYGYVAEGFSLEIKVNDAHGENKREEHLHANPDWQSRRFEINTAYWGIFREGYIQFVAKRADGGVLFERSLRINAMTGGINDTDLANMLLPAVVHEDFCFAFGLYNSDAAIVSDLPKTHQIYACITPNQKNWQERLFEQFTTKKGNGALKNVKLGNLLLPGSHDAGMYLNQLPISIANLANTQKDSIDTQLKLGARYFDFRPGIIQPDWEQIIRKTAESQRSSSFPLWEWIKKFGVGALAAILNAFVNEVRHIHSIIPGITYENFLRQVISFLNDNKQEIVFVKIANSGFIDEAVKTPSKAELENLANELIRGTTLKIGDKSSLKKSLHELLEPSNNERLIICYPDDKLDEVETYSDAYESYDAQNIIEGLTKINSANMDKKDRVDAQLQLTATSQKGAITRSLMALEPATSPLLATKPRTDERSYHWLLNNLNPTNNEVLITACNDFYDNALTEVAYKISAKRLSL